LFTFHLLTSRCIAVTEVSHYSKNLTIDVSIDSQTIDYVVEQSYWFVSVMGMRPVYCLIAYDYWMQEIGFL